MGGGPLAELGAAGRADTVTDSQDEVKVAELDGTLDFAFPLSLNCQGFLDSSN